MGPVTEFFSDLKKELTNEIEENSKIQTIPKGVIILKEGQFVSVIPIVLEGLIRVYTLHDDKEPLLYYIQKDESCIMSFNSSIKNEPSKVYAICEEETKLLLIPSQKFNKWIAENPKLMMKFLNLYNKRYENLISTINGLIFEKLDIRLLKYLEEKSKLSNEKSVRITHQKIAYELGTAREVISRIIKKLESEGKLIQHQNSIEIL